VLKIVKNNPFEDNYFDDVEIEVKTQVYYDTKKPIRGFAYRQKNRQEKQELGRRKT
jgi:hypothetical protein